MIKSMTGYGNAKGCIDNLQVTVEVRSVNNKFLDAAVRMPRGFLFAEETVKNAVQKHISRGKVDVFVNIDQSASDDIVVKVNESVLKGYLEALQHISEEYGIPNDATTIGVTKFPDVLTVEKREINTEAFCIGIESLTEAALEDFDSMRLREGEKLRDDVLSKMEEIRGYVGIVEQESPRTVADYRARLEQRLAEVLAAKEIDESRIITEAAIFADHIAVDEETVRLRSHMAQLKTMVEGSSPIGRKLDFLVQEFNREANTIGSKCQNADIAHVVVDLKSAIEKIREQVQNIE